MLNYLILTIISIYGCYVRKGSLANIVAYGATCAGTTMGRFPFGFRIGFGVILCNFPVGKDIPGLLIRSGPGGKELSNTDS